MRTNVAYVRNDDGTFPAHIWPGGYPVVYLTDDGGVLCADCANMAEREGLSGNLHDPQWSIAAYEVHLEGAPYYCDHCCVKLESAYGDPEEEEEAL